MRRLALLLLSPGLLLACESVTPPLLEVPPEPGWNWENPRPLGSRLTAVRAAPDGTLFAAGFHGAFLRHVGRGWEVLETPFIDHLLDLWVFDAGHVMVVGARGRISEWRSGDWTHHEGLTQNALGGIWSDGKVVVVVGDAGTRLTRRGGGWTETQDAVAVDLEKVWGTSPDRLWVVSTQGRLLHYDGVSWETEFSGLGELLAVWGTGPDDVFAAGNSLGSPAILQRVDGTWLHAHLTQAIDWYAGLGGTGPADVWGVRLTGTVSHFDGDAWSDQVIPDPDGLHQFTSVVSVGGDLVVTADYGGLYRLSAGAWTRETEAVAPGAQLRAVWGNDDGTIWAVGNGPVLRSDGAGWELDRVFPEHLFAGWSDGQRNWAVGAGGGVVSWEGTTWTTEHGFDAVKDNLLAILGFDDGSRVAVGENGIVLRDNGLGWNFEEEGGVQGTTWTCIWGTGKDDYFIAGEEGKMRRYRGTTWENIAPVTIADLTAMWGTGLDDIYAVGTLGAILHFDGEVWLHEAGGFTTEDDEFTAVFGLEGDVLAATREGLIYRFDGEGWSRESGFGANQVLGTWGDGEDNLWAVGSGSMILRHGLPPD